MVDALEMCERIDVAFVDIPWIEVHRYQQRVSCPSLVRLVYSLHSIESMVWQWRRRQRRLRQWWLVAVTVVQWPPLAWM